MANINIDQLAADLRRYFYAQVQHYGAWVVFWRWENVGMFGA